MAPTKRLIAYISPFLLFVSSTLAWCPTIGRINQFSRMSSISITTSLPMALDYNDPVVAEEFNAVQPMSFEEVEEELMMSGVRASADLNEMDIKLMLVELRMRLSGKMPDQAANKKQKPTTFSSKFEEAMWTKPVFAELYEGLHGDHNSENVVREYLNDPKMAQQRYGKDYKRLIVNIENALNAVAPVTSPTISFSGFPANMGEMGCKMTLEALGPIMDFACTESEDFPILEGTVTFEDIDTAKRAIEQYNGMDMGMGQALEVTPS